MSDDIINRLATYARHYTNPEKIRQNSGWHWAEKHAEYVSRAIQEVLPGFPDPQEEAREIQRKEQLFREIQAMAWEDFLKRFQKLANECDQVICSLTVPIVPGKPEVRFCARLFMCRPNKNVSLVFCNVSALWPAHQFGLQKYPDYYMGLIDCPITIPMIHHVRDAMFCAVNRNVISTLHCSRCISQHEDAYSDHGQPFPATI
jgi:hypothetical protein